MRFPCVQGGVAARGMNDHNEPMADHLFADARLAALYDAWSPRSQRADFDFYMPMVMAAASVLDAGCGTGAMLHEARAAGHAGRLCGLDPAPGMLAQARKRMDIEWICGDLASVTWASAFDLAVMTGHAFQVLVEDDHIRAALAAIRAALKPTGRFAFETRNPAARAWENWIPGHAVEIVAANGETVRITTQVQAPFDGRIISFTHTFACDRWDRPEISWSTLRFLSPKALSSFLAEAGFVIEQQFGDWDRQPLTAASPEISTVARAGGGTARGFRPQPPSSARRRFSVLTCSMTPACQLSLLHRSLVSTQRSRFTAMVPARTAAARAAWSRSA